MKKNYNYFVSRKNTPKLKLYTCIMKISYSMAILNMAITHLYARSGLEIGMIIAIALIGYAKITSNLKSDRGLAAAIGSVIVFVGSSLLFAWLYSYVWLYIVCIAEIILGILVTLFIIYRCSSQI